jgi:hypothetical protein
LQAKAMARYLLTRAIVDPPLRVNGVCGFRVVDCFVILGHVPANGNAPNIAICARAGNGVCRPV